jgi:hypothetical protein
VCHKENFINFNLINMNLFNYFLNEFKPLQNEPYYARGILPTEAFAFMSYCKALQIDMIIESGTAYGQSCYLFAKYLNIEVHTIDDVSHYGIQAQNTAKDRCKELPVHFHVGNSLKLLPQLLDQYPNKKIAVFIDGPKGDVAKQFRKNIWNYSNVLMAALHDSVGENVSGKFSTANHSEYLSKFRDMLDNKSLDSPYADNPTINLRERFPNGMGMDIWYKENFIITY